MPTPYQLDFIDALKHRFELTVVYFTRREKDRIWELTDEGEGYRVIFLDNSHWTAAVFGRFNSVHYSPQLRSFALKDDADFVIVNGTYWSPNVLQALKIAYQRGKCTAFWSEAIFDTNSRLKKMVKVALLKPVLRNSDCLLAIGKLAEKSFRHHGYHKPIYQLPYNIDIKPFGPQQRDERSLAVWRDKFNLSDKVVFLSSGSLIPRKGMDTLVKAFRRIEHQNCALLVLGDGEQREALLQLAAGDERIHLLGFQPKKLVPVFFQLADVFVFASQYDGWGLVINEASASGLAIISSCKVGAVDDAFADGLGAMLCHPGDVESFTTAMKTMLGDAEKRKQLQQESFAKKERFSSEYCAAQVEMIFSQIRKSKQRL